MALGNHFSVAGPCSSGMRVLVVGRQHSVGDRSLGACLEVAEG